MTYTHKDVEITFSEGNAKFLAEVDGTQIQSESLRECRAAIESEQDRAGKIAASRKLALPVVFLVKGSGTFATGTVSEGVLTGIHRNTRDLTIANMPRGNEATYVLPDSPENRAQLAEYAMARSTCLAFENWHRKMTLAPGYGSRIDAKDYGTMLDALERAYAAHKTGGI